MDTDNGPTWNDITSARHAKWMHKAFLDTSQRVLIMENQLKSMENLWKAKVLNRPDAMLAAVLLSLRMRAVGIARLRYKERREIVEQE